MVGRVLSCAGIVACAAFFVSTARADEPATRASLSSDASTTTITPSAATKPGPAEASGFPRIGGHLGFAVPLVTIAKDSTAIGADFVAIGLTPGITVKLSERWKVDFEFIAMNELKRTPAATTFVVDPGVVYDAGPVSAGLRVATQVGAPSNIGLVPIIVLPLEGVAGLTPYVEADVPMFLRDDGTALRPSVGLQFQAGVAF